MKDRIMAFLQNENKSYTQFAEEIGVQPSGISHILSGRNNPSLDFVIKMLHRYPSLSAEWLLFGRGSMYKVVSQPTLFDSNLADNNTEKTEGRQEIISDRAVNENQDEVKSTSDNEIMMSGMKHDLPEKRLARVIFFYSDKTFSEYLPS